MGVATVWKYELDLHHGVAQHRRVPRGARVIDVGAQPRPGPSYGYVTDNVPCVWVLCDPTAETEACEFRIIETGEEFPDHLLYLGSFHLRSGRGEPYVGHVFQEPEL